ncbi:Uncharacterised protein [Klebsiella pneumoniae]|nr:Uncharacterised protein [Klebsiella pneumoniae]
MANVPQRNVQQSYIPHDRERSICRKSSHENGLHARRHTDGPTGLNRGRSAKMCCSLNSGYPLTFRLNSRDSAALPLSVTCTSRYPRRRALSILFAGTASLAPNRHRLPDENIFRSSRDRGSRAYAVAGVQYCARRSSWVLPADVRARPSAASHFSLSIIHKY